MRQRESKSDVGGFTVIELLLVIGLLTLVGALVMPVGFSFYRSQAARETGLDVLSTLRGAQIAAISGAYGEGAGVQFLPGLMVWYTGPSYASRVVSRDRSIPLASDTVLSGLVGEVHFTRGSGDASASGTLSVLRYGRTTDIRVPQHGPIAVQ